MEASDWYTQEDPKAQHNEEEIDSPLKDQSVDPDPGDASSFFFKFKRKHIKVETEVTHFIFFKTPANNYKNNSTTIQYDVYCKNQKRNFNHTDELDSTPWRA